MNVIGQLVYYQIFQKYMRGLCSSKCINIFSHSLQNLRVVLVKVLAPSTVFLNRNQQLIIKKDLGHSIRIFSRHLIVSHDLLTAKLNAYRFSIDSL